MATQPILLTSAVRSKGPDRITVFILGACAGVATFVTIGIVLSLIFETIKFFQKIPIGDFLFGLNWSPQTAIREDQVGSGGSFGVLPLINGTLLISAIAMAVATPLGLMFAVYLSEYSVVGHFEIQPSASLI